MRGRSPAVFTRVIRMANDSPGTNTRRRSPRVNKPHWIDVRIATGQNRAILGIVDRRDVPDRRRHNLSAAIKWGSTAHERSASYPCEEFVPHATLSVFRAIDIAAPVPVVFRWLCQLRVAPYSYDLLDNLGRRSPRELTAGADELEVGQRVMTIFYLASFERDSQMTIVCDGIGRKLLGHASSTYTVAPAAGGSRMVLKLAWIPPGGRLLGAVYRPTLPGSTCS
jgi:hypothetical protein